MSSYIVGYKTINRILTYLFYNRNEINISSLIKDFKEQKDFEKLGKRLLKMNIKAVNYRYDEKNDRKYIKDFKFIDNDTDIIQVLKSIQCLKYQCYEGNIPKTKLFKLLKNLELSLMDKIITEKTDYNKKEWG